MHETAIAQDIIAIVTETLKVQPSASLTKVRVTIGEMVAVVPALLHHAYEYLTADTQLQNSALELDIIPISSQCNSCHKTFGINEFEFFCPYCQSSDIRVKTGNEFYIKELEVEPCP